MICTIAFILHHSSFCSSQPCTLLDASLTRAAVLLFS